jgi:uroporphyrin-III C-methyltransferase
MRKVYLIGAGPGDAGLITVKGLELLKKADVIIYDRLASEELLRHAKEGAELIYVGKRAGKHSYSQEEINRLLIEKAGEGKLVVRLKGGDPFVFGRGGEEALALIKAGVDFEVVPGVTSAVRCRRRLIFR